MSTGSKFAPAPGAGGARGIVHVGVLKVLQREGIPVDVVVGTSIGALVGAAYAENPDVLALEKRTKQESCCGRLSIAGFWTVPQSMIIKKNRLPSRGGIRGRIVS